MVAQTIVVVAPGSRFDAVAYTGGVAFEGGEDEDGQMEVLTGRWKHWRKRWSGEFGLLCICRFVDRIQFERGKVDGVAPVASYPAGMNCGCQGIRVVRVHLSAPNSAAKADLLAFLFRQIEPGNTDRHGAVFLTLAAWDGERRGSIDASGIKRHQRIWSFNGWRIQDRAEVLSREVANLVKHLIIVDSRGWYVRSGLVWDSGWF